MLIFSRLFYFLIHNYSDNSKTLSLQFLWFWYVILCVCYISDCELLVFIRTLSLEMPWVLYHFPLSFNKWNYSPKFLHSLPMWKSTGSYVRLLVHNIFNFQNSVYVTLLPFTLLLQMKFDTSLSFVLCVNFFLLVEIFPFLLLMILLSRIHLNGVFFTDFAQEVLKPFNSH